MNSHSTHKIIRFGVFEADLQREELRRAGVRIRLQAQPFKVLTLLLERPGEIVTREDIVQELWKDDTFVDFDQSIGAVMRKLRLALGDSATAPRYVETLRHKGYRFLLSTQTDDATCVSPPDPEAQEPRVRTRFPRTWMLPALAAAMALVVVVFVVRTGYSSLSTNVRRNETQTASSQPKTVKAAHIAYQKGRYLWNMRTAATVQKSIGYFQQAVKLDPDYAPGYAGLADAYVILNFYTGRNRRVLKERAATASRRALKLDDSMAEAHATQAYIRFYYDWDWLGAESGFRRAISLNPNYATAHQWYAEYLFYMGRFEEADREINRAHELDPQSVVIGLQLASPHMYSRNYVQAIDKIREALKLNPEFPLGIYMLATCYEQLGRFDIALAEYQKIAGTKMGLAGLGYVYGRSGRHEEARQILQQLLNDSRVEDLSAFHVARVYAGLGDASQAFAWLKKARDGRDERMVMVKVEPKLDTLRSNPLFGDLLESLNLL